MNNPSGITFLGEGHRQWTTSEEGEHPCASERDGAAGELDSRSAVCDAGPVHVGDGE